MRRRLLPVILAAAATAGCGSSSGPATTAAGPTVGGTTTAAGAPSPPTTVTVFRASGGKLGAAVETVPQTRAVAAAALRALGVDAAVRIQDGTATVDLPRATSEQVAEIVYTLTGFRSVQRVDVAGRTGLTREDVAANVPPILVEAPAAGATVPERFEVSGTASVFEATLVVELRRGDKTLSKQTVTASAGAPGRGTFSTTLHAPSPGPATVVAYAPSAADGTPQHEQDVPVGVSP